MKANDKFNELFGEDLDTSILENEVDSSNSSYEEEEIDYWTDTEKGREQHRQVMLVYAAEQPNATKADILAAYPQFAEYFV